MLPAAEGTDGTQFLNTELTRLTEDIHRDAVHEGK